MSKLAFLTMVTLVAAILSLSMFTQAFASEESHATPVKPVPRNDKPIDNPVFVAKVPDKSSDNSDGGSSHHGKIGKINRLFRSNNNIDTEAALDSIPVIQPLNDAQLMNGINTTKTATVTIPICDGVVPGPCLDKTTGQIIP